MSVVCSCFLMFVSLISVEYLHPDTCATVHVPVKLLTNHMVFLLHLFSSWLHATRRFYLIPKCCVAIDTVHYTHIT